MSPVQGVNLAPLVQELAEETTVVDGFEVFIDRAVAELEAHKDDPAAVQSIADQFKALKARMSAALVKGTAALDPTTAEPTPPVEEPPVEEPPVEEPPVEEPPAETPPAETPSETPPEGSGSTGRRR